MTMNTRPTLTEEHRKLLSFARAALLDDKEKTKLFIGDPRYDRAAELLLALMNGNQP